MTDFKDSTGKVIGTLLSTEIAGLKPNTFKIYKVDLYGLGEWSFLEPDKMIDDSRIKAIAEYKRACIEGSILEVQSQIEELQEEMNKLKARREEIQKVIEGE